MVVKVTKNYQVVALIPIKKRSKRYSQKNFRLLGGKPLYRLFLEKIEQCNFDAIFVDTDSKIVKQDATAMGFETIDRPPELAEDSANGNDLLNYQSTIVTSDIYFQLFVTAPLLRIETINRAVEIMRNDYSYDSLFTAQEIYSWHWFRDKPVNYDPAILPRSQDAEPIIRETTGLYAIRRTTLEKKKCRIGDRPYMLYVDDIEAMDIDNSTDFFIAESIMKNL